MSNVKGDAAAFDINWKKRVETSYLHWTRTEPVNQIQLAFRRHWITFNKLIKGRNGKKRCLEVGCGRGSLSAYFSDAGWDATLLDLSPTAIEAAQSAFKTAGLTASFDVGDCLNLPYQENSFDLVFSIGLLEHFEDVEAVIAEQVRILAPDGLFIGYVVPHIPDNIQKNYEWVNNLLKALLPEAAAEASSGKADVFRSDLLSPTYIEAMKKLGLSEIGHSGVYPLPMVSHSTSFPFSLLPAEAELELTKTFKERLNQRETKTGQDPWLCEEGYGQAFLIWGRKSN